MQLYEKILSIEVLAARLEGAFLADPQIGAMWRAQAALSEVCRSVGLEGVPLSEGDLVSRQFEARQTELETARGSWLASEILKVLVSPVDFFRDPERCVQRCYRAAPLEEGSTVDPTELGAGFCQDLTALVEEAPSPLVAALRATSHLRLATESANPAAERLFFTMIDHALRSRRAGARDLNFDEDVGSAEVLAALRGDWVFLPSCALTAEGFRAWQPTVPSGQASLLEGLQVELSRAMGQLPLLRRWRAQALAACEGKHGKSRLRDLVHLLMEEPILTTVRVANRLNVSGRTGLNLMNEGVASGFLAPITGRRTYRAWAPTPLADYLCQRRPIARFSQERAPLGQEAGSDAMAALDAALAQADKVLRRS